jgi:hypothetical protein
MLATALFFTTCTKDACELTSDDMDWLLEEYDSLNYLKNGTDTVVIPIETFIGQSEYDWEYGIRTGDNDYYGGSIVFFPTNNKDTLSFKHWINACDDNIKITVIKKYTTNNYLHIFYYNLLKDSLTNNTQTINGKVYDNCFHFSDPKDTILQEFIFVKEYGVIMFQTHQNELFELLPLNQEQ